MIVAARLVTRLLHCRGSCNNWQHAAAKKQFQRYSYHDRCGCSIIYPWLAYKRKPAELRKDVMTSRTRPWMLPIVSLCTCVSKAALVPLNNEAPYNSSQHCLQVQSCQTCRLRTWPPASLTSCSSRPCRLYFVPQDSHSRAVHIFQRSGPLSLPFFVPQSSWQPNMWLTQNTLQVLPNA